MFFLALVLVVNGKDLVADLRSDTGAIVAFFHDMPAVCCCRKGARSEGDGRGEGKGKGKGAGVEMERFLCGCECELA